MRNARIRAFWKWFRNVFCFISTWLLLLLIGWALLCGAERISVQILVAALCFAAGGAALFYLLFIGRVQRRWSFTVRFTLFMAAITVSEAVVFARLAILDSAAAAQWATFLAIVAAMYAASMMIFAIYSRRRGVAYTEALHAYQDKMEVEEK